MQSVNRALDVMFLLAAAGGPRTASSIARELDLPRPTVYRILDTLAGRGLVVKTGRDFSVVEVEMRRLCAPVPA
ncbi:MAG: helix-turn-helix domain-containing protein [Acidimicrobiia bacterium]|nr:helix-turn-helix domain-containing protein [Acidimicrobiia bacterium]